MAGCSQVTAWNVSVIDRTGVGSDTSLALDGAGNPAVAYFESGSDNVKLARWNGSRWVVEVVGTGQLPSLALNAAGDAVLSWDDIAGNHLYFVSKSGSASKLKRS